MEYRYNSKTFSFLQKRLNNSQYEGLITLIPKPDEDNFIDACNYRPITLLNRDYK